MTALNRSRYRPLPTQEQLKQLVKGLEAYVTNEDSGEVNYRKILEAPIAREFISINGIFPKIVRLNLVLFYFRNPAVYHKSRSRTRKRKMKKSERKKRRLRKRNASVESKLTRNWLK